LLIERLLNDWKIDFELASVSGWRTEQVQCRRSDGWNGAGTQRRRQPLTEADAAAFPIFARDERAGNDGRRAGAI